MKLHQLFGAILCALFLIVSTDSFADITQTNATIYTKALTRKRIISLWLEKHFRELSEKINFMLEDAESDEEAKMPIIELGWPNICLEDNEKLLINTPFIVDGESYEMHNLTSI